MSITISKRRLNSWLLMSAVAVSGLLISIGLVMWQWHSESTSTDSKPAVVTPEPKTLIEPSVETTSLLGGLSHIWEIAFLPDGQLLFNERGGSLSTILDGQKKLIHRLPDVYVAGEGGFTGMAVDVDFVENRFIYGCYNARTNAGLDVRVMRWKLAADLNSLSEPTAIVTSIPSGSGGRHSGCRIASASDGNLWIGTGDAAQSATPQSPASLGGKILHITRDGMPAPGTLSAPFDPRIFSFGHRNTQGLVLFDKPTADGFYGYSVEHGTYRDDEVNLIRSGNFGWAALPPYNESPPMTDLARFPEAIAAVWSSGGSTVAPSGAARLSGSQWGKWQGRLAMTTLKGEQLKILDIDKNYKLVREDSLLKQYGRLRTAVQGPDGNLYLATDNGSNDQIIKVTPSLK